MKNLTKMNKPKNLKLCTITNFKKR